MVADFTAMFFSEYSEPNNRSSNPNPVSNHIFLGVAELNHEEFLVLFAIFMFHEQRTFYQSPSPCQRSYIKLDVHT